MRKTLAIFFIYLATFSLIMINLGIHQNSIRNAIHHYNHHKLEDTDISIASFLMIHYCPFSKHENLPAAELPLILKHLSMFFSKTDSYKFVLKSINVTKTFTNIFEHYIFQYNSDIFNPPQ